jgi:hypothetical protein
MIATQFRSFVRVIVASAAVGLMGAVPSGGGGGEVIPASANPKGQSLLDMAAATAVYNTGVQAGNPLTPPPPEVPFEVLVGDVTVRPGTFIYLPIFVADDSGGAPAGFPANVSDQNADATYLEDLIFGEAQVSAFVVQVDGRTTVLDADYISGTKTAPLLDGTPAGTNYIVDAAFLTPLSPGKHVVGIGGLIDGEPVGFLEYGVTVK